MSLSFPDGEVHVFERPEQMLRIFPGKPGTPHPFRWPVARRAWACLPAGRLLVMDRVAFGDTGESDGERGIMHSASGPAEGKNILGE